MSGKHPYTAVAAYMYAGGFTQGMSRYFQTLRLFQDDNYGYRTFSMNFLRVPLYNFDEEQFAPRADVLYANPPCAIFSSAAFRNDGTRVPWSKDPRVECWENTLGLVDKVQPTIVAIESVQNALTKGADFIEAKTRLMIRRGYAVTWLKVNAQNHGVAQNRPRFFFIASKLAINWRPARGKLVTVDKALAGVDNQGEVLKWADPWYAKLPAGAARPVWEKEHEEGDVERHKDGRVVGRPSFTTKRLHGDRPGYLMLDKALHPHLNRFVTLAETKAIMGFPKSFKVHERGSSGIHLLMRGVCPPVAAWLGRQLSNALDEGVGTHPNFKGVVNDRPA